MAMKQQQRKVYKTMQGKTVDLDALRKKNELTPAVGNARVNARGDEIGPGGQIVRKKEDIVNDYYTGGAKVIDEVTSNSKKQPVVEEPAPVKTTTSRAKRVEESVSEEWIEDEDGNFVRKGE